MNAVMAFAMVLRSVLRHGRIDFARPCIDAAVQVVYVLITLVHEEISDLETTVSVMANDDDFILWWQVVKLCRYLTHGDVSGAGQSANVNFPGLAYIQDDRGSCPPLLPLF